MVHWLRGAGFGAELGSGFNPQLTHTSYVILGKLLTFPRLSKEYRCAHNSWTEIIPSIYSKTLRNINTNITIISDKLRQYRFTH